MAAIIIMLKWMWW